MRDDWSWYSILFLEQEMPFIIQWDVIPHEQQRYETAGDWKFFGPDTLRISVSQLSDPRYEKLLALHETIEATLCQQMGIEEADVTAFDMAYEECRRLKISAPCNCWIAPTAEPGNDLHAPYHAAHVLATQTEREAAHLLGVNWHAYCDAVEGLGQSSRKLARLSVFDETDG